MFEFSWAQNVLLGCLLFTAVAAGWWLGRQRLEKTLSSSSQLPRDYFIGLNYLINEQPDHATDVFVKMLEVNSDTVEAHLALGNLFRRKGEVERAIRLHQNLIARPTLDYKQRTEALLALAQDYMSAGLLDRAEGLFLDLCENTDKRTESLKFLIDIYEQEKDWPKAIEIAERLEKTTRTSNRKNIAHYYCELAEGALASEDYVLAKKFIHEALTTDKECARASILEGRLLNRLGDYREAVRAYRRVKDQNPAFLSETLEEQKACYEKLGALTDFVLFLKECLAEHPSMSIIWMFAKQIKYAEGGGEAEKFMMRELKQRPSLRGLYYLLELHLETGAENQREDLFIIRDFVKKLTQAKPIYRCKDCGFSGKKVYWQCPSCKRWSSVLPIQGLEGE